MPAHAVIVWISFADAGAVAGPRASLHSAGGSTDRSTRQGASAGNRHDRGSAGGPDCAPLSMRCCVRVMFAQPDTASAPTL